MPRVLVPIAAALMSGLAPTGSAGPPDDRPANTADLQRLLPGTWSGDSPCSGTFLFRANGTYELTGHGPGLTDSSGTWRLRGTALPATLVLTCKASDDPDEVGQLTAVVVVRLDDGTLAVRRPDKTVHRHARVKPAAPEPPKQPAR
jgi:hypothetical protein